VSDREKEILTKITEAIPTMSDFDKGYLLGKVEQMAADKPREPKESTEKPDKQIKTA
jgi:hypothetical protein